MNTSLSAGERSSLRYLLSSYASRGNGFFRYEEISASHTGENGGDLLLEYRGAHRSLPPFGALSSFEHDLCVATADLLGDDVIPEVIVVSGDGDSKAHAVGETLVRYGTRVSYDAIPDGISPGGVVLATGARTDDIPRLRNYLESGGTALFLITGVSCDVSSSWKVSPKTDDPLIALLGEYGIIPSGTLLASPRGAPLRMPALDGSRIVSIRYPFWIRPVPSKDASGHGAGKSLGVLSGIPSPTLLWASPFDLRETEGVSFRTVLETERDALALVPPVDARPIGQVTEFPLKAAPARSVPVLVSVSMGTHRDSFMLLGDEQSLAAGRDFADTRDTIRLVLNCVRFLSGKDAYSDVRRETM